MLKTEFQFINVENIRLFSASIAVFAITGSLRLPALCVSVAVISITDALRVHNWLLLLEDKPSNLTRPVFCQFICTSLVNSWFARRGLGS